MITRNILVSNSLCQLAVLRGGGQRRRANILARFMGRTKDIDRKSRIYKFEFI
jgi:hypothetical protein